ncbi:hypothetical protein CEQ90_14185 [Lewinellaceae bacterium SD302]|nr:hypothetical protein CEQ90_14185 [Lewinellaceae bacterium SD302]
MPPVNLATLLVHRKKILQTPGWLLSILTAITVIVLSSAGCVEAVKPVYKFRDGFLLIDGKLSSIAGNSYLRASTGVLNGIQYSLEEVPLGQVVIIDGSGNQTEWIYLAEKREYVPPASFESSPGETYYVSLTTTDGEVYESTPETMPASTDLEEFDSRFVQESFFSDELNRFVPAFELSGSFQDDPEERNFYRLSYISWERLDVCLSCNFSQYNPFLEECVSTPLGRNTPRFDYACDTNCWEKTVYQNFRLFTDEFSDGNRVEGFKLGQVNYDWHGKILIIGKLEKISAGAHEYARVLREQSLGSGGLNATLPASLAGNMSAVDQEAGGVLGYFAVAAESEAKVFFDRDTVQGSPLPFDGDLNYDIPPPPAAPYVHPCEGPNRSTEKPAGWPE